MSEDPIGFQSGDVNFYRYARNNTLRYMDPYGKLSAGAQKIVDCLESKFGNLAWEKSNNERNKGNQDDDLRDAEHYLYSKQNTSNIVDLIMYSGLSIGYSGLKGITQPFGFFMKESLPSIQEASSGVEGAWDGYNRSGSGGSGGSSSSGSGCPGWCNSSY